MQRGAGRTRSPGTDSFLFCIPSNGYQYGGPLGDITTSDLTELRDPVYESIIIIFVPDAPKKQARQHAEIMARLDRIERALLPPVRKP